MEGTLFEMASEQGVWAALFIFMLFYVLKTSGDREKKLIDALDNMKCIKDGVERIEKRMNDLEGK